MLANLFRALVYSVSLGVSSFYFTGVVRDVFQFFYQRDYFSSEFSLMRLRLICFGMGVAIGIEKAFERVSLLRAFLLVAAPTWLAVSVCYELEIEPPNINITAGMTGIFTGGLAGMIEPEVVNWLFIFLFILALWIGELVFLRATNTEAFAVKKDAILLILIMAAVFSLPAVYTVYDALANASKYDEPLVLNDKTGFIMRHIAFPSVVASALIFTLYATFQRFSAQGDSAVSKFFNWVIGAPSDTKGLDRRGAQESVGSSEVRRGEISPPPQH